MRLPNTLRQVAEVLTRLPSIGPRQAIRLALYLSSLPQEEQRVLVDAIQRLTSINRCVECGFPHEGSGTRCEICADPQRSARTIMVVEKETDLLSMEKTGKYTGRYLIMGSLPRGGTLASSQKELLNQRITLANQQGGIDEVILAVSATTSGEILGKLVSTSLQGVAKRITRLGRGLPRGGEIEFADEDTLGYSLENRA